MPTRTVPAADLNPAARSVAFNAMDKNVHRRPGYAFALARSSDRISKYEYMSGENLLPWFQGDGAYYLYLSGQDQTQAFGVDYFTTVSPYGLAGVTAPVEQRRTIPELYGTAVVRQPGPPAELHLVVGVAEHLRLLPARAPTGTPAVPSLGAYGAAGLVQSSDVAYAAKQDGILPDDFVVYRNAEATKSWFMLDDEIVVLAAGVGDQAGRAVTTTVDARHAAPSDQVTVTGVRRDGRPGPVPGAPGPALAAVRERDPGHRRRVRFLDDQPVTVGLEQVTRSRRVVRTANPDTAVTRNVFGVTYHHPAGAHPASLAYALVPNATADRLASYQYGPLSVLANNERIQAVMHSRLGLTLANVFSHRSEEAAGLSIDGPASVIVQRTHDRVTVAASDPTMDRDEVSVLVRGGPLHPVAPAGGVRVRRAPGGTLLEFDTHHAHGRSLTVTLTG